MAGQASRRSRERADFAALRDAFVALSWIYRANANVAVAGQGVRIAGLSGDKHTRIAGLAQKHATMIRSLVQGAGQRSSVAGRREVVLSVVADRRDGERVFEIAGFLVVGRGTIRESVCLSSRYPDWAERLAGFTDWESVDGVIAAAEGNNQRAMIGLALQLAGIGRGRLQMIEVEIPEESDEATHMVKGADWMKAGLPRFDNACSEALWYLMRIRSVHSRMIKVRKQGYYTSMALAALHASGISRGRVAAMTGMPPDLVEKLTPKPRESGSAVARFEELGPGFAELDREADPRRRHCADRAWRGAAIYAGMLDRRLHRGRQARERLAAGDDLVSVAADLGIELRDLIRILSVSQPDADAEKQRFVAAVIDPELVRSVAG